MQVLDGRNKTTSGVLKDSYGKVNEGKESMQPLDYGEATRSKQDNRDQPGLRRPSNIRPFKI